MPNRKFFAETWTAVNTTCLLILAFVLMFGPFLVSLIANIGRRVPETSRVRPARLRPVRAARTLPS